MAFILFLLLLLHLANAQICLYPNVSLALGSGFMGIVTPPTNGLAVQGNTELGCTTSLNKLDVSGGTAIGQAYACIYTAPGNGSIIQGPVGIGTPSPNAALALDVTSTTQAFAPPRMNTTQVNAISSPPDGSTVYDTTIPIFKGHVNGAWLPFITPWIAFTTVIGATVTNPTSGSGATILSNYMQIGNTLLINYYLSQANAGTAGSGNYLFGIPPGYTINTSIAPLGSFVNIGMGFTRNNAGDWYAIIASPYSSTQYSVAEVVSAAGSYISSSGGGLNNNPCIYTWQLTIPINAN